VSDTVSDDAFLPITPHSGDTTLRETALQEFRALIESLLGQLDGIQDGRFPWGPTRIAEIERKLRELRQLVD
jgi:hypothetical protein